MRLAQSPRGERKFVTVCTDHVEKEINEHSGFLKLTWWKSQGHKDATLRSGTSWVAGACSAVSLYQEVHVNPLTVFIFQLEQFTPLFCNSFPLVKLVSALFTCTPTVSQTPNHKHLETLSCLNCLDWSELSGTTKLRALKLEFVITRVKISVDQSRGLKRASRSLSLAGKTQKMCVRHESLFLFCVFEHLWLCSPSPTVKTTTQEQQGEKMRNKYACVPCNRTVDTCTYSGDQGPW